VKLTLTELLRELGDEQDMLGNLVQSEELGGGGPFFVDKTLKCCSQNVVRGRLRSSGMSLSLFLSFGMERPDCHWTGFHNIWSLWIFFETISRK
jgi:hypothetical protein